jgi:hypothetical protein
VHRSVYLFGGSGYDGLAGGVECLDLDALTWHIATVGGDLPTPGEDMAATWAEDYDGALVFGGAAYHGLSNRTWLLVSRGVCTLEGVELTNEGDTSVPVRGAAMAWVPGEARALVMGGQGYHTLVDRAVWVSP